MLGDQAEAAEARYRFWTHYTAAQARGSGRPAKEIGRRVVACFHDLCQRVDPTLSVEIGAHEADFSGWVTHTFPAARAVAFEANPYVYQAHHARLTALGVDYRHAAVAAETGSVSLKIPTEVHGRARQRDNRMGSLTTHGASGGHETVDVPAVRLDDLGLAAAGDRVVAWIDVEGATGMVLPGARELLARASLVFIEVENTTTWEGQWLDSDVARFFDGLGKLPLLRDVQRRYQYNVVYAEPTLALDARVARRAARALAAVRADTDQPDVARSPWQIRRGRASRRGAP